MKLDEWPLYINDYGNISCGNYSETCSDDFDDAKMEIARRTTFSEFKRIIIKHAREIHQIELSE
jgi:hypothetical protein